MQLFLEGLDDHGLLLGRGFQSGILSFEPKKDIQAITVVWIQQASRVLSREEEREVAEPQAKASFRSLHELAVRQESNPLAFTQSPKVKPCSPSRTPLPLHALLQMFDDRSCSRCYQNALLFHTRSCYFPLHLLYSNLQANSVIQALDILLLRSQQLSSRNRDSHK